jgi:hypothetical protein
MFGEIFVIRKNMTLRMFAYNIIILFYFKKNCNFKDDQLQ